MDEVIGEAEMGQLGFTRYGNVTWLTDGEQSPKMEISDENVNLKNLRFCLYAFVIGSTIVRIGKFQGPISTRIEHRANIITRWFNDDPPAGLSDKEPPLWEAWFGTAQNVGAVWCGTADVVGDRIQVTRRARETPSEYLERVEMALIARYYPPINVETMRQNRLPPIA